MKTNHYPSDLTDAQWAQIEPHLPTGPGGGRPRKTAPRDVLDAILYILRAGRQWRYLPIDFPPKSTVWRYFDRWRRDGALDRFRRRACAQEKSSHPRTPESVDSQSVDTTSRGEQRDRDNAKEAATRYGMAVALSRFLAMSAGRAPAKRRDSSPSARPMGPAEAEERLVNGAQSGVLTVGRKARGLGSRVGPRRAPPFTSAPARRGRPR